MINETVGLVIEAHSIHCLNREICLKLAMSLKSNI